MASKDSLEMRSLAAKGAIVVSRDDTPVALRIRYVSNGTVTSVTNTSATSLVTVTVEAGAVTTTKTYAYATYTTIGALADKINSDGLFQAVVLDALRSDSTASSALLPNSAITSGTDDNGVVVWDLNPDTSVNKFITATLSLKRNFDALSKGHRVHLQEIVYNVDINAASANSVRVYQRNGTVETQLFGVASVDVTKTTINWASGLGKLTGAEGAALIVRVQDATSVTDSANNFVQATGIYE